MTIFHLSTLRSLLSTIAFFLLPGMAISQTWRSELYPENWTPPGEAASFYNDKLIQDFSYAGYQRGDVPLPNITGPIFDVTDYGAVPDTTGDSTLAIQAAINAAAAAGGGVVYLPAGTFRVSPQGSNGSALRISSSNIVLRGAGTANTFLLNNSYEMWNKSVILIQPPSVPTSGSSVSITADLPGPTRRIPVDDVSLFSPGQFVRIEWEFTDAWIAEHNQQTWWNATNGRPANSLYFREVLATNPAEGWIEVDAPTRYSIKSRDNAVVIPISGLLHDVGVESLSIGNIQHPGTTWGPLDYTDPTKPGHAVHNSWLIRMANVRDSWITDVHSKQAAENTSSCHMLSNGIFVLTSYRITLRDCEMRRAQYGGEGGNGYMFRVHQSNECLLERCIADFSRHGIVISHPGTSGNVFLRCEDHETQRATGHTGSYDTGASGSDNHMHFSHSNLFDRCHAHNSYYTASHRGTAGSVPHGLSSAHAIYWNTSGSGSRGGDLVRSEQGRYGYVIGTSGSRSAASNPTGGNTAPADHLEGIGMGATMEVPSLYADQFAKRMQGVLVNVGKDEVVAPTSAHPLSASVHSYGSGPVSVSWSQLSGPPAVIADAASAETTVALNAEGSFVFEVTAEEGDKSASAQVTITVDGSISVTNTGATSVNSGQATLNGVLDEGNPATIHFVWDTADRGTNLGAWASSVVLSDQENGALSTTITGLTRSSYVYRIFAENSVRSAWSLPASFSVPVAVPSSLSHHIRGESEDAAATLGYFSSTSNVVGTSGASGQVDDRNVVFGYTLPTLEEGATLDAAAFHFEITQARDATGAANLPELHVYLLDSEDPSSSGVGFFYHGLLDPAANAKRVGSTSVPITGTLDNNFTNGAQARSFTLAGDALALLQSYYDGHVPTRTTAYFRFNMSVNPPQNTSYRRYRVNTSESGSSLEVFPVTPSAPFVETAGGATALQTTSATLRGRLAVGAVADAFICWGSEDGGTASTGNWQNVIPLGEIAQDTVFSAGISGLYYGLGYTYRIFVSNSAGSHWSDAAPFETPAPPPADLWTPAQTITSAWYDASDSASVVASGGAVSQWNDKSPNNRHLTQGTAARRPQTGTRAINGRNALAFTDDFMDAPSAVNLINGMLISAFVKDDSATVSFANLQGANTQWSVTGEAFRYATTSPYWPNNSLSTGPYSTGQGMVGGWIGEPSLAFTLNGNYESKGTGNTGTGSTSYDRIGARENTSLGSNPGYFVGAIGEIIAVPTTSAEIRQLIEGYLAHKWGTAGNLPGNHPYKLAAPATGAPPFAITNTGASSIGATSATVGGTLVDGADAFFTAYAYVSPNDNPDAEAWFADPQASATLIGSFTDATDVPLSVTVTDLAPSTGYFHTVMMVNTGSSVWAAPNGSFTTTAAPSDPFENWAGQESITFTGDSNGDGVADGLAWLLGAGTPAANATTLLPVPSAQNGALSVSFHYLVPAKRGAATLRLQHSGSLAADSWTDVQIPDESTTVDGVEFIVTPVPDSDLNHIQATMPASAAVRNFVRLAGENP